MGSNVPSAVDVAAMATAVSSSMASVRPKSHTRAFASARLTSHVTSARRPARPVSSLSSIS
jgi:hypothetical protein